MAETPASSSPLSDEPAFVAELTAHQGILLAYLTSLLPGESELDDILQCANLVLWEKRSQFEPGTSFKAWALAVTYWQARAWMTERKRKNWLIFDDELARSITERFSTQPDLGPSVSVAALRNCLGKLKENDRLLVLSHYQHDKSCEEISRIFDRPANSIKVSLFRIRGLLRRCINSQLSLDEATS